MVSILFAIVPDYGNEYTTKENKHWTSFKNLAPKLNLNHNSDLCHAGAELYELSYYAGQLGAGHYVGLW